jgi:hypothetical protein
MRTSIATTKAAGTTGAMIGVTTVAVIVAAIVMTVATDATEH